jgi:hypothetical protein
MASRGGSGKIPVDRRGEASLTGRHAVPGYHPSVRGWSVINDDLTNAPNATGVGEGVWPGAFTFDAPDDQTCLRASVDGERRSRNGAAPSSATAEPRGVDDDPHFPPLDIDSDSDDFQQNLADDDSDILSVYSLLDASDDDEEHDEPVAETQQEEVQATLVDAPNEDTTEPDGAPRGAVRSSDVRREEETLAHYPAEQRAQIEDLLAQREARVRKQERGRARQRRRRNPGPSQATLSRYWPRRGDDDVALPGAPPQNRPSTSHRRLSEPVMPETYEIPVPQDPQGLYDAWITLAVSVIPENASVYSNFRHAFGDETDAGCAFRRKEMKAIGKLLLEFKENEGSPGQHAILKGREREGKTGALFSIALAALLLRMRVVILCAPNKVAPVVDMVKKLRQSGFHRRFSVKHTLGKKATEENGIPSAESGQIFVAALCTVSDLKKVKSYIEGEKRGGHFTVTLVDECDEITQGKGQKSLYVERREDPHAYQEFIHLDQRGEDEDGVPHVRSGSHASRQLSLKQQIAAASEYFKKHIHVNTQIFACSATLSGYIMNPIGNFKHDVVTPIFMVYPKPGYRGIETFKIPQGCTLETEGNLKLEQFQDSGPVNTMLRRFYDRRNACDGQRLLIRSSPARGPEPGPSNTSEAGSVTLRGMLFISCSPKVYVYGGFRDIATTVCHIVTDWPSEERSHDPNCTLFVCFVGAPWVFFNGKWERMTAGKSVEDMYNKTEEKARNGKFGDLGLGANDPLSNVCTHVVLIGYNLTRRAMTAAFRPASEPNVLCKVQYGILTSPKALTIDTVSQRINRPSHDFGEHEVPDNYSVDVAMSSLTLSLCQKYRKMEDEMVEKQRAHPKPHGEFRQEIDVFAKNLDKTKVSKRGILLAELSRTGQQRRRREEHALEVDQHPVLVDFAAWLVRQEVRPGCTLAASTVENYYRNVRLRFINGYEVEDVEEGARHTINQLGNNTNITSGESDTLQAMRYFVKYREEILGQSEA